MLVGGSAGTGVVRRSVLPSGLSVVTEGVSEARAASVGVWVGVGARDEHARVNGATHFLEHLLFKGTATRGALDIAREMDAIGGQSNAVTMKEQTCYYAQVRDTDAPTAVELLGDMVTSSVLDEQAFEGERRVIHSELARRADNAAQSVSDTFELALWGDSPLGRPVLGSSESVSELSAGDVAEFYRARYTPANAVVAVAGNVEHERIVSGVAEAFGAWGDPPAAPVAERDRTAGYPENPGVLVCPRDSRQASVILGCSSLTNTDERRFAFGVLSCALGGGLSSRLFQEVRERRGLCYTVSTSGAHYADTGLFGVFAATAPERTDELIAVLDESLDEVAANGITDEELAVGKAQLQAVLVLGSDTANARMTKIGRGLLDGDVIDIDRALALVDSVDQDDVREVAADVLNRPRALAVHGPFGGDRSFRAASSA
ncbi:insulinase family protein [Actinopolyspora sp. BKK1]|nr:MULTISPECIES: pitrilysin family protein [unclassified Actinopolyspora]NHD18346.1 insulinase family protein [Actinopolyspora sp. BKK2]NHE76975.1 insulinase family protein [Actinopolyspora sp. BKK1]